MSAAGLWSLLGGVPVLAAVLLYLLLQGRGRDWRESVLVMSVVWGVLVTAITETLSLGSWLARGPIAAIWIGIAVALVILHVRTGGPFYPKNWGIAKALPSRVQACIGALVAMALLVAITAVLAPPNTWDALTYHMSRVMHWLQNGTVAHYPTSITRQLYLSPWAEFAIAQFVALTANDHAANLVQWYAWVAGAVAVSVIARQLNATVEGQVVAAVFWATLPMGILQATSSKNDLVVTLWLLCFVYFAIALAGRRHGVTIAALAGAALGLAVLTKGTAYIYAAPFVVYLLFARARRRTNAGRELAVLAGCALALNAGHYARNMELWSAPTGPVFSDHPLSNSAITPGVVASNLLRNVGLHAGTPSARANAWVEARVRGAHAWMQLDPDDPGTTWPGSRFEIPRMSRGDENAGNLLHLLLAVVVSLMIIAHWRDAKLAGARWYFLSVCGGLLLFCALLKWQPWHSRLHVPLFGFFAPLAGLVLAASDRSRRGIVAAVVLLVAAVPWTLDNWSRRLVPLESWWRPSLAESQLLGGERLPVYFHQPAGREITERFRDYVDVTGSARALGCESIGLLASGDAPEYLVWVLLRPGAARMRIEHVGVTNESARKRDRFEPCAVLCLACPPEPPLIGGHSYFSVRGGQHVQLLLPAPRNEPLDNAR